MNIVKEIRAQGPYIRFELGLENLIDEAYRYESIRRASTIYRSIFDPEDEVIFMHRTSYGTNEKRISKIRLKRFFLTRLKQTRSCTLPYEFDESDDEIYTKEWTVEVIAKEIRMLYVLESIENANFMRKPSAGGQIYLYNKTKGILFHMYDDRGCDVYSSDIGTLLPLYHLHRKWILDYNRYEIDNLFGEGLAGIIETDEERKNRWEFNDKKITHSGINLREVNTCHISHHFEIPFVNAKEFAKEIALSSFSIQQISKMDDKIRFIATKTQALALIDYQTHLMSMYGKKFGTYAGWSFEKTF
ncbi:DUF3885 domain-containing protein [Paenibacillus sp. J22TS3]|uniref:DUF3885 domain-containing protein n=1 Tax=Paenibacillus sp. J22TS3 TaxID=2807192 RepID=UPI001B02F898|nr:DUF3885 domain-containing protein [Paenibacillus sp. J22TS3]GIP19781.1 hypothetical protein J22TS3_00560 [Paenibacillus sp. J22TS3]